MAKRHFVNYKMLDAFLIENPGASYKQYKEQAGSNKISDVTFYLRRKELRENGTIPQNASARKSKAIPKPRRNRKKLRRNEPVTGILPGKRYGTSRRDFTPLAELLLKNPTANFRDMQKMGINLSNASWNRFRNDPPKYLLDLDGVSMSPSPSDASTSPWIQRSRRSRTSLYYTLWQSQTENVSKESLELLSSFINELNSSGRSKMEIIQRVNPNIIEVREVSK